MTEPLRRGTRRTANHFQTDFDLSIRVEGYRLSLAFGIEQPCAGPELRQFVPRIAERTNSQ